MADSERDGRQGPAAPELLRRLLPRLTDLGITRLGDVTGLDRLGIPVMQAARPLSLSNSVAQGKGATPEIAALSAILETAECFFAERLSHFDVTVASAASLAVDPQSLALHVTEDCPAGWAEDEIGWAAAEEALSGTSGFVPLALVHTAYVHPPTQTDVWFQASTTGLAVAATRHDALLHGLLECIERDALARVPVVWCHLLEENSHTGTLIPYPSEGSAAGLDAAAAAVRAIREAAQSRLAAISGAREDITRLSYPRYPDWDMIEAHRKLLRDGPRSIHFDSLATETPGDWLADLLARGEKAGLSAILAVDLDTEPFAGLSAVKVFVPALAPLGEA